MPTIIYILILILGILIILKSGDLLVDSAINISAQTGISQAVIGVTIVSLATTLPEVLVSITAVNKGSGQMAISSGLGSIICNIGLVLSISLIAMQQKVDRKSFLFKGLYIIFSFITLFAMCLDNKLTKFNGVLLLIMFFIFFLVSIKEAKNNYSSSRYEIKFDKKELIYNFIIFIIGAAGIGLSANLLVSSAKIIAIRSNVSEAMIGATVLAFGTCLPELITTLTAIRKKTLSLAIGNIIGANTINCTLLIGSCAVLSPTPLIINETTKFITIPLCILFNFILVLPILIHQKTRKTQGLLMLCTFVLYYFIVIFFRK